MELPINTTPPFIMHIDLNSCFATVEQQAYPHLRNKPVVIAAYISPRGFILSPSIEAKKLGIKMGMTVADAQRIYRSVIVRPPDPPKYRTVHMQFRKIFSDYSPSVVPKSIDEAVLDFTESRVLFKKDLVGIAKEIKQRMRQEIGEWISCSIGISTNRFLAKLGASLHKPDGLDVITHENLLDVYNSVKLMDLCGINVHYQARLNINRILTPVDFLNTPLETLWKKVFRSICGYYWYVRLRGHEIDSVDFERKSYGHSYALPKFTANMKDLSRLLMKLTEKMGRRIRNAGFTAKGIHVSCLYADGTYWQESKTFDIPMYTTQELFVKAHWLLTQQPEKKPVRNLAVSCFHLRVATSVQLDMFDVNANRKRKLSDALDKINDRYGEFVITPALMMDMDKTIIDRIAFGGVRDIESLYE